MHLTILGCGTLGEAILGGLLASGAWSADKLTVTARRQSRADELAERYGVRTTLDNHAAIREADAILVSVKPQTAARVLPEFRGEFQDKLLISTLAGVRLSQLQDWSGAGRIIRSMPNTPALIREGMTVFAPGPGVGEEDIQTARSIFGAVGRVQVLNERLMDVVTGLSGSGPAFAFVVIESLADGGVMMGLPRDAAIELAAQTVQGAARLVLETGNHPAALKDQVTTPAGCTIAGLLTMEDGKVRSTLARAIQEATEVASGLGDVEPDEHH